MNRLYKHPWLIIVLTLAVTAVLSFQLKDIKMDNSTRLYFPQKHASYQRLIESEDKFGGTVVIGVSLETDKGTIITPENLQIIDHISTDVENLPYVDRIDSLTKIDFIEDVDGALTAGNIIDVDRDEDGYLPLLTMEQVNQLKQNLTDWDEMYTRSIISDDNRAAQMQITLIANNHPGEIAHISSLTADQQDTLVNAGYKTIDDYQKAKSKGTFKIEGLSDEELSSLGAALDEAAKTVISESDLEAETLKDVKEIAYKYTEGTNLKVIFFGDPVVSDNFLDYMTSDLAGLIPLVSIVVLLTLFASLKTLDGTLLPLITVLLATACTCGLMAVFGFTFTIVSSVIPVALIACGSAYGIHVMTHYYIALDDAEAKNVVLTKETHKEIILKGVNECKTAVFLAAITTVIGFISLISSPMGPLHSFSIFTAIGIALSWLFAELFIPSVLMIKPVNKIGRKSKLIAKLAKRAKKHSINRGNARKDTLYSIFLFFCGSKPRMAIFIIVISVVSIFGVLKINIDSSMINYFPSTSKLRQDVDYVDERFAGTNLIFMMVDGPKVTDENGNILDENGVPVMNKDGKYLDVNGNIIKKSDGREAAFVEGSMKDPDILEALDGLQENITSKFDYIGKVISFPTLIKRMNQVLHAPSAEAVAAASASSAGYGSDDFGSNDFDFDFGSDDFGSTDSDFDFGGDDFGSDAFADSSSSDSSETYEMLPDYVDPNIAYVEKLNSTITVEEGFKLLTSAYAEAGGKNATLDEVVKVLEKKLNYKGTDFYEIPYDEAKYGYAQHEALKDVVGNFLVMLSDKDTLGRWAYDPQNENVLNPSRLRVQLVSRSNSTGDIEKVIDECNSYAANHFPEGYTISFTGKGELEAVMTDMVFSSQIQSLIISLLSVIVVISLSFKSVWAGLLGAIPLALTILLNYWTMGTFGINLDLVTSIIASVAVGIGIDYTIHFLETYRNERAKTTDVHAAARRTFKSSGSGILTNALAVGLGFLVLCLSKFLVLRYIGILVAIVMFTSSMLAMTILPGFLTNFDPKFSRPKVEPAEDLGAEEDLYEQNQNPPADKDSKSSE